MENKILTPEEFTRLANNFYVGKGLDDQIKRVNVDAELFNFVLGNLEQKKLKIAFCCVCLNPSYWQFIKPLIEGARGQFLPGHNTDFFLWSDITDNLENLEQQLLNFHLQNYSTVSADHLDKIKNYAKEATIAAKESIKYAENLNVFSIEPEIWPMPTLMRYHLMLQQEEKLREYDYIFYCDIDMQFVSIVGDEILGEGLTAVQQPMYAVRKEFWPPYEPNPDSASYIKRPGRVINDEGKPRFKPLYFAGGFQGGKSDKWIEAMKVMKGLIDKDLNKNYIPIWNDETVFNKYMLDHMTDQDIILTPSYTYPDSLQKEYFEPMWGCSYYPKLVTLTKKFSFSQDAGEHLSKALPEISKLK